MSVQLCFTFPGVSALQVIIFQSSSLIILFQCFPQKFDFIYCLYPFLNLVSTVVFIAIRSISLSNSWNNIEQDLLWSAVISKSFVIKSQLDGNRFEASLSVTRNMNSMAVIWNYWLQKVSYDYFITFVILYLRWLTRLTNAGIDKKISGSAFLYGNCNYGSRKQNRNKLHFDWNLEFSCSWIRFIFWYVPFDDPYWCLISVMKTTQLLYH